MTDQLAKNLSLLPELCYVTNKVDQTVVIIKRGEDGFYSLDYVVPEDKVVVFVNEQNAKLGVTPAQALAMEMGSMFGWNRAIADPEVHEVSLLIRAIRDIPGCDALADEAARMQKAGTSVTEIRDRFKDLMVKSGRMTEAN